MGKGKWRKGKWGKGNGGRGKELVRQLEKIKFDTGGHADKSMSVHTGGGSSSGLHIPSSSLSLMAQIKTPPQSLSSMQVMIDKQIRLIH